MTHDHHRVVGEVLGQDLGADQSENSVVFSVVLSNQRLVGLCIYQSEIDIHLYQPMRDQHNLINQSEVSIIHLFSRARNMVDTAATVPLAISPAIAIC